MFDVIFYSDSRGKEPTAEFICELRQKSNTDKNARINLNKIVAYIDILCEHGTRIGEPVVKTLGRRHMGTSTAGQQDPFRLLQR